MDAASIIGTLDLDTVRAFYAEEIRADAQLSSARMVQAFARVPREAFLGPGPWRIASPEAGMGGATYRTTGDADARHVYHNVSIALDVSRNLFNGQPGSLARWMDSLALEPGVRAFHMGCGVGYCTAIMAESAGPDSGMSAALRFIGLLDVPSITPAGSSVARHGSAAIHAALLRIPAGDAG